MKTHGVIPVLGLLLIASQAVAADKSTQDDDKDKLSGNAKLGFIYSKTSSSSTSLNSGIGLKYNEKPFTHEFNGSTYYTNAKDDDDGVNKYTLNYKFSYALKGGEGYDAYIDNEYKHDQYETYRHVYDVTVGIQKALIATKKTELNIGGGPGYRYTKRQDFDDDYPNQVEEDVIVNAFINGKSQLTDALSVGGSADVDYGESNTTYTLGANLTNKLVDNVALVFDSEYIYNTDVASDDDHDELYSTISITYAF
ncbi:MULTISPECIES: DUF481 domain-containing protein [Vibrio]|uniref:DUF481 domain-containing protein n=2 Tax=Vibrio TaxID=662 RepID=A0A7X4LNZ3_9VIBR|nr:MULTISPECIES: DUF481 domain-containing protein [Vibrio]MBF9001015.1 DUF481 domain-containing protein [Vibrio nitrifigilis]MZI95490.1 DUF481 domain-containing protein [Vibrio eleionomae]